MPYPDVTRFAWALLASLLLHLSLVVDISPVGWQGPASPLPPIEVNLSPISIVNPSPPPVRQRRSPTHAVRHTPTHQDAIVPEPAAVRPDVFTAGLTSAAQEPTVATSAANDALAPAPASQDDAAEDDLRANRRGRRRVKPKVEPETMPPSKQLAEQQEDTSQHLPASGRLVYRFYWGEAHWLAGHAIHEWVVADGLYTLSSTVTTTGLFALLHPTRLVETAKGLVLGDKLRPLQFMTQLNDYPPVLAMFDWDRGRFRWFRGNASFTQDLPGDSYDKISFLYQLYLAQGKDDLSSAHISMGRALERYDIENLGLVDVDIDGRIVATRRLRRLGSPNDSSVIDVWLSTIHNLPIKITYSNAAGDHFEQLISPESMPVD